MDTKVLKNTIHTYKDYELENILVLAELGENLRKVKIIKKELRDRKLSRTSGNYVDKTLDPKIPIRKR